MLLGKYPPYREPTSTAVFDGLHFVASAHNSIPFRKLTATNSYTRLCKELGSQRPGGTSEKPTPVMD